VVSATAPVALSGLTTYPGVNDDGSGNATPQYGLSVTGSLSVSYTGASLHAITAGFFDGGTNTLTGRGIGVLERTGGTASPVDVVRGVQTYGSTGGSLDVPVHLSGIAQAREHSAVAWTYDPSNVAGGKAGVAGTLYLAAVYVPRTTSITKIIWGINTVGSGVTASQNFVGLYNSTGTLLASAGVDARITTTGLFTETVSSTPVTAGLHWVGFMFNATGMPAVYRGQDLNATLMNFNLSAASMRYATNGTGFTTALPNPITPASNAAAQFSYWAAIA
jgi:hypothetical protein